MTFEIVLINLAVAALTGLAALAGGYFGARHALRNAKRLTPLSTESTVEIGGVVMPQSHYSAARFPLEQRLNEVYTAVEKTATPPRG